MSDESEIATEVAPVVLAQEGTAIPAQENQLPEGETPVDPTPASRTFTQEELDAAIEKRLAKARRSWEREARDQAQPPAPVSPVEQELSPDQFPSPEAYTDAVAERKAAKLVAEKEANRVYAEIIEAHEDRTEQAREKYNDYDAVVENPKLHITDLMADVIRMSEVGPEVAYYLGMNLKEAERIAKLPPVLQAKEIGKLEAKVLSAPPVKQTSSAPEPITPIRASGGASPAYDTTDPRSTKTMTPAEWIAAENARVRKQLESRHA